MPSKTAFSLVLVTTPDIRTARKLAKSVLRARLAACANLVPKVESHYWWKGRIEMSSEVLMIIKTPVRRLAALERLVLSEHPYEVPEFIVLPITSGNRRYLAWVNLSANGG